MHRLRLGLFRGAIVADANRIAAALRYQQELEAAQRPATMNPNLAAQGTSSRNRLAAALSSQNSNPIAEFARQAVSLDPQPDQGYGTMAAEMALGFVPGVGQAMAARDIERARRDNDPVGMGMAASSFVPFGKLIGGLRKPMSELITYHGSPHRFPPTANNPLGEFDPMKIGTGEGAQAYGAGAGYLAEAKGTATGYRDTLAHKGALDLEYEAGKRGIPLNREAQVEFMRQSIPNISPEKAARSFQNANIEARNLDQNKLAALFKDYKESKQGNLYKVDLPDEQIAKMLDWDKPLEGNVASQIVRAAENTKGMNADDFKDALGLSRMYEGQPESGSAIYRLISSSLGSDTKASEWLKKNGIPGIRYLDQGSRSGGAGTSNFVVFDPKHMNIIGRE